MGNQFVTFSFPDRKVRVFDFPTGKLYRTYDESIETIMEMQQAGTAIQTLEEIEFGRRIAIERELDNPVVRSRVNVIFDETGHFIILGSILGTKVLNTLTNKVVKVYGKDEPFRPLNLALYQGQPDKKGVVTVAMAASDNPLLQEAEARDAMLVSTGSGKVRFYMFTNDDRYVPFEVSIRQDLTPAASVNPSGTFRTRSLETSMRGSRRRRSKPRLGHRQSYTLHMVTFTFAYSPMQRQRQLRTSSRTPKMGTTITSSSTASFASS